MNNPHKPFRHKKNLYESQRVFSHQENVQGKRLERNKYDASVVETSYLIRYIQYLKSQDIHTQRIHAFTISGIVTFFVAIFWLHTYYGMWSFADTAVYDATASYEEKMLVSPQDTPVNLQDAQSPWQDFSSFFTEARDRLRAIDIHPDSFFSSTTTFERGTSTPK